jgi:hypothetical protein
MSKKVEFIVLKSFIIQLFLLNYGFVWFAKDVLDRVQEYKNVGLISSLILKDIFSFILVS